MDLFRVAWSLLVSPDLSLMQGEDMYGQADLTLDVIDFSILHIKIL